jgi:hypothetical protein
MHWLMRILIYIFFFLKKIYIPFLKNHYCKNPSYTRKYMSQFFFVINTQNALPLFFLQIFLSWEHTQEAGFTYLYGAYPARVAASSSRFEWLIELGLRVWINSCKKKKLKNGLNDTARIIIVCPGLAYVYAVRIAYVHACGAIACTRHGSDHSNCHPWGDKCTRMSTISATNSLQSSLRQEEVKVTTVVASRM